MSWNRVLWGVVPCLVMTAGLIGCGGSGGGGATGDDDDGGGGMPLPLPSPACAAAPSGAAMVATPQLTYTLKDRFQEAFLGSPSVADLDGDGTPEIIVPRDGLLIAWHAMPGGGSQVAWSATLPGRIWASPIVGELVASSPGLEVAVASGKTIVVYSATGKVLPGFPFVWQNELRSLAAGDIDGDGVLDLIAVTTTPLDANNQRDSVIAIHTDGKVIAGFPPNTTGAAQCDASCVVTGGYDQNLAVGDVDGDHKVDVFVSQDNAYMALHSGTGLAFDAAPIFNKRKKFSGVRWMVDYALAQQGFANNEDVDLQAHFTNTGPAIADLDGDGTPELIALGSVQNASQDDRLKGVGLFVSHKDGTRPADWVAPPLFPKYLGGLWDSEDSDNIVGMTNQVAVADIDPAHPGLEVVFAGFDGAIHAVDAHGKPLWSHAYTTQTEVWTSGVVIADLSGDGVPEIVFATYSPNGGDLIVLDAAGNELHKLSLGGRGAMPVPTIADVDGDGTLDIVVSLKDAVDKVKSAVVFSVPGSAANCMLWPTARGNDRRDGYVPPAK